MRRREFIVLVSSGVAASPVGLEGIEAREEPRRSRAVAGLSGAALLAVR